MEAALSGTSVYVTELSVTPDNTVTVEVDSDDPVDIDTCAALTGAIEDAFDRDIEDYALEVGSAGITSPLKIRRQYLKNIGNDMEVLTKDGRKLHGALAAVEPGDSDTNVAFVLDVPVKVKEPGAKRPVVKVEAVHLDTDNCKYVRPDLKF